MLVGNCAVGLSECVVDLIARQLQAVLTEEAKTNLLKFVEVSFVVRSCQTCVQVYKFRLSYEQSDGDCRE